MMVLDQKILVNLGMVIVGELWDGYSTRYWD